MQITGHLALATLTHLRVGARTRLPYLAFGTLLPDLIDKSLWLAGFTVYGRSVGHSLLFWGAWVALGRLVVRGRRPKGASGPSRPTAAWEDVALGGALHLGADLADDVFDGLERSGALFSAWWGWPWTNPDMLGVWVEPAATMPFVVSAYVSTWAVSTWAGVRLRAPTLLECATWAAALAHLARAHRRRAHRR